MQFSTSHQIERLMASILSAMMFYIAKFLALIGFGVGVSIVVPIVGVHPTAVDVFSYAGLAAAAAFPWFIPLPEDDTELPSAEAAQYIKYAVKMSFITGVAYWVVAIIIMMILPGAVDPNAAGGPPT